MKYFESAQRNPIKTIFHNKPETKTFSDRFLLTIFFIAINTQTKQKHDQKLQHTEIFINLDFQLFLLLTVRTTQKNHE